jgi:hypothetical protein
MRACENQRIMSVSESHCQFLVEKEENYGRGAVRGNGEEVAMANTEILRTFDVPDQYSHQAALLPR